MSKKREPKPREPEVEYFAPREMTREERAKLTLHLRIGADKAARITEEKRRRAYYEVMALRRDRRYRAG